MPEKTPFSTPTPQARQMAQGMIAQADHAALASLGPDGVQPSISRIALAPGDGGVVLSLLSDLAPHKAALRAHPACALLLGQPSGRGDPLAQPRLSLHCQAQILARPSPAHDAARACFLAQRPKAALYADFGDFHFVVFTITDALLNAGFGKAYKLTQTDLQPIPPGP
jgi:putative heme iron utilization protein